jgi:hypothetical protein
LQDFSFMGGSLGMAAGKAIIAAPRRAVETQAAAGAVFASGGARMQEGILSLMQMPRTTVAVLMLREAGLPYIVVLTNPTTGGVTASYAMLGDVQIAEPGALIGFAGPRVIEQTIREKLPRGVPARRIPADETRHGMVDMVRVRVSLLDRPGQSRRTRLPPVIHVAGTNGKGSACCLSAARCWKPRDKQRPRPYLAASGALARALSASPRKRRIGEDALPDAVCSDESRARGQCAGTTDHRLSKSLTAVGFVLAFAEHVPADVRDAWRSGSAAVFDATNVIGSASWSR